MIVKMRIGTEDKQFDLKRCPFCGRNKARFADCKDVQCCGQWETCREDGPVSVVCDFLAGGCGGSGGFRETYEEAAEAWNKRVWSQPVGRSKAGKVSI